MVRLRCGLVRQLSYVVAVLGALGTSSLLAEALPHKIRIGHPGVPEATDLEVVDPAELSPTQFSEAQAASGPVPKTPVAPLGNLPGEFEKQSAILIGSGQLADELPAVFARIALLTRGRVNLIALAQGDEGRRHAQQVLADQHIASPHLHFVNAPHNSMWARDFGPLTVRQHDGHSALVDTWYTSADRMEDDAIPELLAETLTMPIVPASLFLDGGNVLTNGRGLFVATYDLIDRNLQPDRDAELIRLNLGQLFGASEVVFLEPLIGEPTAHVDMFCTFVSADTVVVASIDPAVDAENARILNHNAARLASMRVGRKRLRVVRVKMPSHDDTVWRSYTNVVYANGLLMVPIYPEKDAAGSRTALALYKGLLPDWQVEPVDAEALAQLGGALHCITMNMASIDRLPPWIAEAKLAHPLTRWVKEQDADFQRAYFGGEDGVGRRTIERAE